MKGVLESVLLIRDFVPKLKDFVSKQFVSVLQRICSKNEMYFCKPLSDRRTKKKLDRR